VPTVTLRIPALPAHVRTVRLVAVAVARRSGVEEALLDEVRLAVGEACSRAVAQHQRSAPHEPVSVALRDESGRFVVTVRDVVPTVEATGAEAVQRLAGADGVETAAGSTGRVDARGTHVLRDAAPDAVPDAVRLAVVSGLVDDLEIRAGSGGAQIAMAWPAGRPG
jgi:serine/threonine-protein kinase RsbW